MGERQDGSLPRQSDPQVQLDLVGSRTSTDAGLVAYREWGWRLRLTSATAQFAAEQRTGRSIQHELAPSLRQSLYSRLARYPDTNDADRLARDPALRLVVSRERVTSGPQRARR